MEWIEQTVAAYLLITDGEKAQSRFLLAEDKRVLIGRGLECGIVLSDPRCSRVHAIVWRDEGTWWVEDRESSNGTYVNGQKVDQAQLADGNQLKMGSTQFVFSLTVDGGGTPASTNHGVTILTDEMVSTDETGQFFLSDENTAAKGEDLFQLFQLTYRLLSFDDVGQVIRECLVLLQERTAASVVGFLWLDDEGAFRPQIVLPADRADEIKLDQLVSNLVREHRALRMDVPQRMKTGEFASFADAICVPSDRRSGSQGCRLSVSRSGTLLVSSISVGTIAGQRLG